jgi:bla regulator protein BlaR1
MESLMHTLFSNALAATVLAVVATCLARTCRRPALTHSLWLLVMVKLITPPFVPIGLPDARPPTAQSGSDGASPSRNHARPFRSGHWTRSASRSRVDSQGDA